MLERKIRRKILLLFAILLLAGLVGVKCWRAWKTNHDIHKTPKIPKDLLQFDQVDCAECFKDIEYVPGSRDPFQSLDLFLPKKPRTLPMPLIIWIHGGGWVSGDKNHPPLQLVLNRGYALASLNYRLSNQSPYPAQIFDCKAAIRYLRAHAREYNLDPERIGLWGHSAGGHLAALLGTSCDVKELEGELGNNNYSSRVRAVAEWAGPSDLLSISSQATAKFKIDFKSAANPVAVLMGQNQSAAAYLAASPIKYVNKDCPPFLILHAENDDVIPVQQAKELCDSLKKHSVPLLCHISPTGGHSLYKREFAAEVMNFFDQNLSK